MQILGHTNILVVDVAGISSTVCCLILQLGSGFWAPGPEAGQCLNDYAVIVWPDLFLILMQGSRLYFHTSYCCNAISNFDRQWGTVRWFRTRGVCIAVAMQGDAELLPVWQVELHGLWLRGMMCLPPIKPDMQVSNQWPIPHASWIWMSDILLGIVYYIYNTHIYIYIILHFLLVFVVGQPKFGLIWFDCRW